MTKDVREKWPDRRDAEAPTVESDGTTEQRWARVTELLDGAVRRPEPRDRAAYLRDACAGDRSLRLEVEDLLRFEDADSGILAGPLLGKLRLDRHEVTTEPLPEVPAAFEPGRRIGPYRIERLIGRGGMGVVALAHDTVLDRQVALKVMRRDRLSKETSQRFERERRVLARMEHPAIARIYDSGELDDRHGEALPYFTMELVDGEPIDAYCDRHRLGVDARLHLVLEIGDALAAAHRNLVVHRDLKPTNILVTDDGRPKLLDFGIAKELDGLAGGAAAHTRTGHQPMTLAWASPEQVRGLPVGVATDVYALGLLLYRLLCGRPAYPVDRDLFENLRRICETIPPPPSSRVGVVFEDWRDGVPTPIPPRDMARARGTVPRALHKRLRGDLDAIVAKALAKNPDARYRSVEALGDDLRRHLDGRPVLARRPTLRYRLSKLAQRHRRELLAAAAIIVSLGLGGGAWFESRRQIATEQAERRRTAEEASQAERQAEALSSFARTLVLSADPDVAAGQPLTPRDLLARGLETARERLAAQPEMLAHQLEAMGLAYHGLGDIAPARALFAESLRLRRHVYGTGDHPLVARSLNNLAAAANRSEERRLAERLYRLALGMKQRLGQDTDELARVENNLASLLAFRGELQEAEERYRRVLAVRRADFESDPAELAASLRSLGNLLFLAGRPGEAETHLREALGIRRRHDGPESLRTAAVWSSLGRVLHERGSLDEARAALESALATRRARLGEDHLHVALSRKDLASLLFDLGQAASAEVLWQEAMSVLRANRSKDAWELADAASQEAARLAAVGRLEAALPVLEESYRGLRRIRGEQSIYARRAETRLAGCRPTATPTPPSG